MPGLLSRLNLLDNWYFVGGGSHTGFGHFPINQRGMTQFSTVGGYIIDRWKLVSGGARLDTDGLYLDGTISQNVNVDAPADYSATVLFNDGSIAAATFDDGIFTVSASNKKLIACKLEKGTKQTLAHIVNNTYVLADIPDYTEQLLICEKYYMIYDKTNLYRVVGVCDVGGNLQRITLFLPSPLAATPTSIVLTGSMVITASPNIVIESESPVSWDLENNLLYMYYTKQSTNQESVLHAVRLNLAKLEIIV